MALNSLSAALLPYGLVVGDIIYLHSTSGWMGEFERNIDYPSVNNIIMFLVICRSEVAATLQVTSMEAGSSSNYQRVVVRNCKSIWKVCSVFVLVFANLCL